MPKSNSATSNLKSIERFVIQKQNEEYNDECYYFTEGYHIHANKVFTDKKKAEAIADELNFNNFCIMQPDMYNYGEDLTKIEDDLSDEQFQKLRDGSTFKDVIPEKEIRAFFDKVKNLSEYYAPYSVETLTEDND